MSFAAALAMSAALASTARADDVLLEIHFQPVPNAQIAIWLVDANGDFLQDVMVTQATGTLGIGNRPGRPDYLSSWRFPYGPRRQVLPVWGHARGKTYPAITYHDDDDNFPDSLGWHEGTSSREPYFCRPLTESEHAVISTDTMTCPSPATFRTDKGKLSSGTSLYPPRNDIMEFDPNKDHTDIQMFGALNDLDAITSATPAGHEPVLFTAIVPEAVAMAGPVTAYLEIGLEHDENSRWAYDRDTDHWVDPWLSGYGVEYLGQPTVVYGVQLDASVAGFTGTDMWTGYGEWDGSSGTIHPPDDSISNSGGSGADRLELFTKNGETFRLGVYSHGPDSEGASPGGWGCDVRELPAPTSFELEPMEFDTIRAHFTIPADIDGEIRNVRMYYRTGDTGLTPDNLGQAIQAVPSEAQCSGPIVAGESAWCEIDQLFGAHDYQVGLVYEDECSNKSALVADAVSTPQQEFQTVEGACFVATAAYGGSWVERVAGLRWFRDRVMRSSGFGYAMVEFYYATSPALADAIEEKPWARALTRAVLGPVADLAKASAPAGTEAPTHSGQAPTAAP
jgi:hypothetical protein